MIRLRFGEVEAMGEDAADIRVTYQLDWDELIPVNKIFVIGGDRYAYSGVTIPLRGGDLMMIYAKTEDINVTDLVKPNVREEGQDAYQLKIDGEGVEMTKLADDQSGGTRLN